jgi:hypothetical protein
MSYIRFSVTNAASALLSSGSGGTGQVTVNPAGNSSGGAVTGGGELLHAVIIKHAFNTVSSRFFECILDIPRGLFIALFLLCDAFR